MFYKTTLDNGTYEFSTETGSRYLLKISDNKNTLSRLVCGDESFSLRRDLEEIEILGDFIAEVGEQGVFTLALLENTNVVTFRRTSIITTISRV